VIHLTKMDGCAGPGYAKASPWLSRSWRAEALPEAASPRMTS